MEKIDTNKLNFYLKLLIIFFLSFGLWSVLLIGASWDEPFHHINGVLRFRYLISFGEFQNFNYLNNKFYPGLYDTLSSFFGFSLNKFYPDLNIQQKEMHLLYLLL